MNWGSIDFNLLVLFDAVMLERSVTRAGERLGLSQSAVSHGLTRLRYMLKDKIFVRTPQGMVPTPLAEHMAPFVRRALDELKTAFEIQPFDPNTVEHCFRIAFNHYAVVVLAARLAQSTSDTAPGIQLHIKPSFALPIAEMLDNADLDLAIIRETGSDLGERFSTQFLLEDRYVAVTGKGDIDNTCGTLSLSTIAAKPHLLISSIDDDASFLDKLLEREGLSRQIVLATPYLACAPALVHSDMLAVLSRRVAETLASEHPIEIYCLPDLLETPVFRIMMVWHKRFDAVPAHCWLREALRKISQSLTSEGRHGR